MATLAISANPVARTETVPLKNGLNYSEYHVIAWFLSSGVNPILGGSLNQSEFAAHALRLYFWAASGGTLIVIADTVTTIGSLSVYVGAPSDVVAMPAQGTRIRIADPDFGGAEEFLDKIHYQQVVTASDSKSILEVETAIPNTHQSVAVVFRHQAGFIVLAPPLGAKHVGYYPNYFDWLATSVTRFQTQHSNLPDWARQFGPQSEVDGLAAIAEAQHQITQLSSNIADLQASIAEDIWIKDLYCASGDELLVAVGEGLKSIGFAVERVPGTRTDLLALYEKQILAIEVKGLDRSARSDNVTQAVRWRSETRSTLVSDTETIESDHQLKNIALSLDRLGIKSDERRMYESKAAIIIGTFRKTSLSQRAETDFPADVVKECKRDSVVAITGLQLACMVIHSRLTPSAAAEYRQQLLSISGAVAPIDWTNYLMNIAKA